MSEWEEQCRSDLLGWDEQNTYTDGCHGLPPDLVRECCVPRRSMLVMNVMNAMNTYNSQR